MESPSPERGEKGGGVVVGGSVVVEVEVEEVLEEVEGVSGAVVVDSGSAVLELISGGEVDVELRSGGDVGVVEVVVLVVVVGRVELKGSLS